jgi:hypothetical protein
VTPAAAARTTPLADLDLQVCQPSGRPGWCVSSLITGLNYGRHMYAGHRRRGG